MIQSEYESIPGSQRQAREKAREQATIGFGFFSYWLKKWREFCQW